VVVISSNSPRLPHAVVRFYKYEDQEIARLVGADSSQTLRSLALAIQGYVGPGSPDHPRRYQLLSRLNLTSLTSLTSLTLSFGTITGDVRIEPARWMSMLDILQILSSSSSTSISLLHFTLPINLPQFDYPKLNSILSPLDWKSLFTALSQFKNLQDISIQAPYGGNIQSRGSDEASRRLMEEELTESRGTLNNIRRFFDELDMKLKEEVGVTDLGLALEREGMFRVI